MTDLGKIAGSQKHVSDLGVYELIAAAAIVFLLIAVQGMYVAKYPITLNAAATAELGPFGIIGP